MFKSVVFHERRPELNRADFMNHWLTIHAPMSEGARELYGYTCNEVVQDVTPGGAPRLAIGAAIDGIAHMWFKTPDGLVTLPHGQPGVQRWFADGPNFIGRRVRFMGEETTLVPPRRERGPNHKAVFVVASDSSKRQVADELARAISGLVGSHVAHRGLVVTQILSDHSATSIAGFPIDPFSHLVEIWLSSAAVVRDTADIIVDSLQTSISSVRALLTHENVIRQPPDGGYAAGER